MPLKPVTKHRLRRPIRVRRVRVRLLDLDDEEERSVALELLAQHHYLGAPSLIGRHILYAVEIGEYCLGLVCFSDACRALSARDRFLGWGAIERERRLGFLVQNDRFLLIPDVPIGNLASRALGLCTRRLAGDWEKAFGVPILGVETFVDPSRFCGTCYQAANWQRIGETQGYGQDGSGYTYHGQPKTVWLYPLDASSWDVLRGRSLPPRLRPFGRKPTENTVRSTASPSRLQTLRAAMQRIPDRRSKRGRTHRISTCLSIIMLGLAAGAETISGCLAFAKTLDKRQLQALGVYRHPRSRKLCLPSYSSICRILAEVDPLAAEEALSGWQQQCDTCPLALAIDGKTLRGSLGHAEEEGHVVVTAYAHDPQSPFFAQTMLDSKGYEREGACRLLARLGDLSGTTVTLDALHACHPICDHGNVR